MDLRRYIKDKIVEQLSYKSNLYQTAVSEFNTFGGKVSQLLAGIVSSQAEADVAVDIVMGKVGEVVIVPDDDQTMGTDHHGRSGYTVEKFDVGRALSLSESPTVLKALIGNRNRA